jgi:hypothetical protein
MRTINACEVEGQRPRYWSTSSTIPASGETSRKHLKRQWERRRAPKQADANMCRSLGCCPVQSAATWSWTSSRILKSRCSRTNGRWYGVCSLTDLYARGGRGGVYIHAYLFFYLPCHSIISLLFYLSTIIHQLG